MLVEFALVAPLLLALLFGIIELGWGFLQQMDVRHGAREVSRLVAVNYDAAAGAPIACTGFADASARQSCALIDTACDRMAASGHPTVAISAPSKALGSPATISVRVPLDTMTGFFDFAVGGITLTSSIETRLEVPGTWSDLAMACP